MERDRFGGKGSLMVWERKSGSHRTDLVTVRDNLKGVCSRDEILLQHVVPFMQKHSDCMTLQHDNARPHTARICTDILKQSNINVTKRQPRALISAPLKTSGPSYRQGLQGRQPTRNHSRIGKGSRERVACHPPS